MSLWFAGTVACSVLSVAVATAKDSDAQDNFNDKYLNAYLPPGDEHYTASWVGQNSSWRNYMSQYSGKSADYQKYLSEYGGPQANYDQYVSLYASMAGADVTSGNNYQSKGKSQLDAWNKSMMTTYNLYIPGAYENFAEQATEERTGNKGQGVGQGTMGQGHGGGGGQSEGSGGSQMSWMPKSGGEEQTHSQSGGGGGEVGYEPFARPWVVQYATEEGGNNAFDYEGKEFASGGMQMGGVQDYADYMNQYASEWVPADSIDVKAQPEQSSDGNGHDKSAKQQSSKDDKSKKAQQEEDKDQKEKKQKKHQDDESSKAAANHGMEEETTVKHLRAHGRSQKKHDESRSAKHHEDRKSSKADGTSASDASQRDEPKSKGNSSEAAPLAFFESAGSAGAVPEAHPAQPVLPRWSVKPQTKELDRGVPHPAQPVLPQLQSKAAKEAVAKVRHAVKQLQQAAQDTSYAAWTLAKHSPSSKQTEEHKDLAEAMSRLWKVTREPLTDKSLQELEDAGRAASTAIVRLKDSEMQHLRRSATRTRQQLLQGAKDWSAQLQGDARKQENEQLAQEAQQAGAQLEKSLSDALSERTQKQAQELLLHAEQRKQLLQGVLGEAVDVARMTKERPSADIPREPAATPQVQSEEATEQAERQNFTTDKLKAVSGPWLLMAITVAGLMYSVAGFVVRRNSAPTRPPSREIALLSLGEP